MTDIPETLQPFVDAMHQAALLYRENRFDELHDRVLKAFVETIHSDHSLQRFLQICVSVPLLLGPFKSRFCLFDKKTNRFQCVCDSENGLLDPPRPVHQDIDVSSHAVFTDNEWVCYPLYPHSGSVDQSPRPSQRNGSLYDPDPYFSRHSLLGLFGVAPHTALTEQDKAMFNILTRWMGNKLNNRLIAEHHLEHLQFLNALGRDIGHNVIVPNMYLKHLLRQLEKQITELDEIISEAQKNMTHGVTSSDYAGLLAQCSEKRKALHRSHQELLKHHDQITLFLESLFREQHFSQGHLVLQPTSSFVERDIILPQLELYQNKLEQQGIHIDKPLYLYEQKFPLMVDVGLLSQVYANLFSNAVKYTREIIEYDGKHRKALAYGAKEVADFPEPGRKGIKFNVFTTGKPLNDEERRHIFEEGNRAENSQGIAGSGHGLNFIQRVIEVHGGRVGCEATEQGNNFYFILPISSEEKQPGGGDRKKNN